VALALSGQHFCDQSLLVAPRWAVWTLLALQDQHRVTRLRAFAGSKPQP
jgi:hypothetical protein